MLIWFSQMISRRHYIRNVVLKAGIKGRDKLLHPAVYHDDVIKWKHFPHYWPFVLGIHQSPVNSRSSKQSWGWWFETPSRPLWRHRNVWGVIYCPRPRYLIPHISLTVPVVIETSDTISNQNWHSHTVYIERWVYYKIDVTPLLTHWSYVFLTLTHWDMHSRFHNGECTVIQSASFQ